MHTLAHTHTVSLNVLAHTLSYAVFVAEGGGGGRRRTTLPFGLLRLVARSASLKYALEAVHMCVCVCVCVRSRTCARPNSIAYISARLTEMQPRFLLWHFALSVSLSLSSVFLSVSASVCLLSLVFTLPCSLIHMESTCYAALTGPCPAGHALPCACRLPSFPSLSPLTACFFLSLYFLFKLARFVPPTNDYDVQVGLTYCINHS